jgi:hypothetical protein
MKHPYRHHEYCPICDSQGPIHGKCQGCGRPSKSPLILDFEGTIQAEKQRRSDEVARPNKPLDHGAPTGTTTAPADTLNLIPCDSVGRVASHITFIDDADFIRKLTALCLSTKGLSTMKGIQAIMSREVPHAHGQLEGAIGLTTAFAKGSTIRLVTDAWYRLPNKIPVTIPALITGVIQ